MLPNMILRSKPHRGLLPPPTEVGLTRSTMAPAPAWLRTAARAESLDDAGFAAGAAVSLLDVVVRRQERWAGVWRQRLALSAAGATARQAGRVEGETALRDAVFLTRPGDDVGPAGRILLAWRRLVTRPADELLTGSSIAALLEDFGMAHDEEADLARQAGQIAGGEGMVGSLLAALDYADRHGLGRGVGAWIADATLAQNLGWPIAVPLLGTEPAAREGRRRQQVTGLKEVGKEEVGARVQSLLNPYARAALRAVDLSAELGRRAERLLTVAPKLRAKAADTVVEQLLSDDAIVASRGDRKTGMSDRGLRRLFDRLVELGAVRELSGRTAFRIYGV